MTKKINKVKEFYKSQGLLATIKAVNNKLFPVKKQAIPSFSSYVSYFENKKGIEIGGPSKIFSEELPIYQLVDSLDGCNFSSFTTWEGAIKEGETYNFYKSKCGHQYVSEASNLYQIQDEKYDFLISSHCLEHCANALKTVEEWLRVIKKGGAILIILPDKNFTFDRNRPETRFEHLLDDYNNKIDEHDLTHLDEILTMHDLSLTPEFKSIEEFRERSLKNYDNRCLHHHIFTFDLMKEMFNYFDIKVLQTDFADPYHQIILGLKQ